MVDGDGWMVVVWEVILFGPNRKEDPKEEKMAGG